MTFAVLLLAADAVLLVALVVLHVAPTGLSPVHAPVSQYALTRFRAGYAVAAGAAAVAGAAAAVLLVQVHAAPAAAFVAAFAVARALIPFFPMDAPGATPTGHGRAHRALAFVAFAAVTVAAFAAVAPLRDAGLGPLGPLTRVCATVMALGAIGVVVAGRLAALRPVFGLVERLIYLGFIGWFGILSVAFLTRP